MNFKIFNICCIVFCIGCSQDAQNESEFNNQNLDSLIRNSPHYEDLPRFPGNEGDLSLHISKNLIYPEEAIKNNIEGKVIVQFIVNIDGSISSVETVGEKIGYGLEEEAIRIVKNMPNWLPGKRKNKPIANRFRLPFQFELTD